METSHRVVLDQFVPDYQFHEVHSVVVDAAPTQVFAALKALTPSELPITRVLMALRSVPSLIVKGRPAHRTDEATLLDQVTRMGFVVLGEEPDREIVLGLVGQPWKLVGGGIVTKVRTPEDFLSVVDPTLARIATNFRIGEGLRPGSCVLSTETRVSITDVDARRRFARYWMVIRPASGLIRREWLHRVKVGAGKPLAAELRH